ncbi:MAG: hypothetical protein CMI16_06360, partial [Opitutaceae bacterium]|nr:hypothetical protein [Opitutaceae bacterium]
QKEPARAFDPATCKRGNTYLFFSGVYWWKQWEQRQKEPARAFDPATCKRGNTYLFFSGVYW